MPVIDSTATPEMPARQRVLLTACRLFYRDGIRATGIDRVIAESGVTKVTFYRHFASKNELVCAYLAQRHERWMTWFTDALARHASASGLSTLVAALSEWLHDEDFRGCAFLNSVSELGDALPEVVAITRQHKAEMTAAIEGLLPPSPHRASLACAAALAVDGAIVQAQFSKTPDATLTTLALMLQALEVAEAASTKLG
ncbi:MAG: TetR family transcriptional regulator [Burkholderiales bacterium RIFCSPLOWO2_12_FULL_64_99]|nr:MAG: TetR family transcriptional regulator [Burkholderiales bacterium RIFCSPHIGHO2_12_FULL_63_20]OGB64195.1 MAG: TetR family transcriptional regulator [Burkholderiales bacterium RIFCSPLOWO2_12_FULL_64_99]